MEPPELDAEQLFPQVYDQLRSLAQKYRWDQDTLQPTALVNEAYLKLAEGGKWESRAHFQAIAARAMRQILIDRARRRNAARRGGRWEQVTLAGLGDSDTQVDLLELNDILAQLEQLDPRKAQIVQLRFFGGLTTEEIAAHLAVSPRTVESDWRRAKAWLAAALAGQTE